MEDFANLLHRDYGLKPQGKMAPMSATKAPGSSASADAIKGKSSSSGNSGSNARSGRPSYAGDDDLFFKPRNASSSFSEPLDGSYDDVFGGPPKFVPPKHSSSGSGSVPLYEDIFRSQPPPPPVSSHNSSRDHSLPVFDAPYEDDIFSGVRGTRSSGVSYDNVFGGGGGATAAAATSSGSPSDDLLGGYRSGSKAKASPSATHDEDLIPGMGSGYPSSKAEPSSFIPVDDAAPDTTEVDPFVGSQPDPFAGMPSVSDPLDPFAAAFPKSVRQSYGSSRKIDEADSDESSPEKKEEVVHEDFVPPSDYDANEFEEGPSLKESWVTVDNVRLVTEPTSAPPPSRPPPGFRYGSGAYVNGGHEFGGGASDDEDDSLKRFNLEKEREAQRSKEKEDQVRLQREIEEREEKERQRREREAVERVTQEARQRAARQAREKAERLAVERATAEARERAAAEARQKAAERAAAEKVAAEKAAAIKSAAEKAAAEKAAAETRARERAAVEKINAQVRERAAEEARIAANKKAEERAAVGRINAQVRERAAEEARKAAAASKSREQQQRSSDDLDGIFGRATSAPRQRTPTPGFSSSDRRGSSGAPVKKVPSASGIDELTNLFDNPTSPFREIDGETADRRKARIERDQRTQARARQALEEKHRRDLAAQREQAEKQRVSEAVDSEIKRWAAGKEGNLRALLSTLQYVLWPECGWQPVSLTDLLTGAAVKKAYRRATLFVHPDKVQQKGATIQQKYIAEKVFDLLKEAWNKFNSEELF